MKPFLLLLSLLISVPVFSQHYRTVLVDKEVYFDFKDYTYYLYSNPSRIINPDSFQVIGNDTIIYHQMNQEFETDEIFDTTYQSYQSCFYAIDTGFMGIKTILQPDGTDVFFNYHQDSIFIKTQANINETWTFHTDSIGNYFEATISNLSYDNFLGISDSVKTITLQAKNNLGNNTSSPYDTLSLKISKHYGLIQGFNLFKFPYGTTTEYPSQKRYNKINLIGLPHLNLGVDNLTAAEIFDFNIGDEFQQLTTENTSSPNGTYSLIKINGKSFSVNNDTVYYDIYLKEFEYNSFTSYLNINFDGDTTILYDISPDNPINTKSLMLDSSNGSFLPTLWIQSADGETKTPEDYHFYTINDCVPFPFPSASSWVTYKAGLGVYFWGYADLWDNYRGELIYYKKNGIEWGTLITPNYLLNTNDLMTSNNFNVFPNPTKNLLNFQFTEPIQNAEIRIYSSIGQLMLNQNVNDTNMQFQVSDWPRNLGGVYFYGIYVEGKVVKQGQVLVQD